MHRCNKRFYVYNFYAFFILKNVVKRYYKYAKIQREILLENASAMIFFLILICYVNCTVKYFTT